MADRKGESKRHRGVGSALRISAYVDPVALVGIALSIVVSIVLDLTNAASGVESFLACLMGITISLILDSTVRAERRFRMRDMIEATPWLGDVFVPLATATADIERRYGGTSVVAEARRRYVRLGEQLDELSHGRIVRPRGDYEHLLAATRACGRTLQAVTNVLAQLPGHGLGWWTSDVGRHYWQANLDALDNGVRIKRIFVYTTMTTELDKMVAEQESAGVHVGLVQADALDPVLWHNFTIWDGTSAWEARLNAGGEIVGNIFTVNEADLTRLSKTFQICERAARPRDRARGDVAVTREGTPQ
ncbi:hypothetical protein ACNTMW_26100 [Planosporangium sp. 12N6]|uniref:hypothetical protein n=1 Tax=Planosporangium spinosum TaxID=3402278 RepID=UPI003CEFC6F3